MFLYETVVTISSDGTNVWYKPLLFKVTCILNFLYFPYDDQECKMIFGSWAHDVSQIDLIGVPQFTNSTEYIENDQWELMGLFSKKNTIKYTCCPIPFADYSIRVIIRRRSHSVTMNIVIPSAILSSLILLSFVLPPESGERVGLCITVLLSVTVFQQMTSQMMPPSTVPYLAQYYFATVVFTSMCLIGTTCILNIYHRPERRLPGWLRVLVFDWLAKIVFINTLLNRKKCCNANISCLRSTIFSMSPRATGANGKHPEITEEANGMANKERNDISVHDEDELGDQVLSLMNGDLNRPAKEHLHPLEKFNAQEESIVAVKVMDRCFLIVFSIGMLLSVVVVFLRAPQFDMNDHRPK